VAQEMSNLNPQQFVSLTHHEGKYLHHIDAHDQDGNMVGSMDWNKRSKRVMNISVSTRLRRQGIASHMWDLANQTAQEKGQVGPQHSYERTDLGDAWAKSVGGRLPHNRSKK
jgi:ribosomal protein S18 acetylase RimI-like enzyme